MRFGLVFVIAACGSEESSSPDKQPPAARDGGATTAASATRPSLDEVKAWMPKDVKAVWQGAWFTMLALRDAPGWAAYTGAYVALEITGDKARAWNPSTGKETELGVLFDKPCQLTLTRTADGMTHHYSKQFVVENGAVIASSSGAGYRKGKTALVCLSDEIYVLDDKGKCRLYKESFGEWSVSETTCAWSDKRPSWASDTTLYRNSDMLVVGKPDMFSEFSGRGDVIWNRGFEDVFPAPAHERDWAKHSKQTDFAAAKATATQRWKETDLVERLKTAGGKPGETKTILDLWTTFSQDKSTLKGKPAELSGTVAEKIEKSVHDGKTEWVVLVVDPRMFAEQRPKNFQKRFPIRCRSPKQVTRAVGATVKISGTVGEWWDEPALTDCVVR